MTGTVAQSADRRRTGTLLRHQQDQFLFNSTAGCLAYRHHRLLLQLHQRRRKPLNLTYSSRLQQESDDAEEVDVSVVNSEFYKDGSGVAIQPLVPGEILEASVNEAHWSVQSVL